MATCGYFSTATDNLPVCTKQQRCRRRRRVSGCLMINGTRCVTTVRLNLRRAGEGPALP
jgi:hypothetical protein